MRIENIAIQNTQGENGGKSVDIDGFVGILEGLIFTKDEDVKKNPDIIKNAEDEGLENLIVLEDEAEEEEMEVLNLFYPGDLQLKSRQMDFKAQDYKLEISTDKLDVELETYEFLDLEFIEANSLDLNSLDLQSLDPRELDSLNFQSVAFESLDLDPVEVEVLDMESLEFEHLVNQEIGKPIKETARDEESFPKLKDGVLNDSIGKESFENSSIGPDRDIEIFKTELNKEIPKESKFELDMETSPLSFKEEMVSQANSKPEKGIESLESQKVDNQSLAKLEKEIDKAKNLKFEDGFIEPSFTRLVNSVENKTINPEIEELGQENIHRITETIIDSIKISNSETSNFIEVQLYPKELGALNIKLKLQEGKITGKILVDNDTVKSLLVNSLSELSHNLGKENVNIEKLEIHIKAGLDNNLANENFSENQNHRKNSNNNFGNILRKSSIKSTGLTNSISRLGEGLGNNSVNILV